MSMSSQNKFRQIWMLFGMTKHAQNLNVIGICSSGKMARVGFNMMSLQAIFRSTFLAALFFFNNLINSFSARVRSFTASSIPKRMIFSSHFSTSSICKTLFRAIQRRIFPVFFNLKLFIALFTRTINKSFLFAWSYFCGTFFGASITSAPIMSFKNNKFFITSRAYQSNVASAFNFSRSICHG
jgi:hypothetical protein